MSLQKFTQQLKDAYLEQDKEKSQEALLQFYKVTNYNLDLALKLCSQIITNLEVGQNLRGAAVQQLMNYMKHSVINRQKPYKQPPLRLVSQIRMRWPDKFSNQGKLEIIKVCAQIIKDTPNQEIKDQVWDEVVQFLIKLIQDTPQINQYTVVFISERLKDSSININELQILFEEKFQSIAKDKREDYIVQTLKSSLELMIFDIEILSYVKGLILNQIVSKNTQIRDIALKLVIYFNKFAFKHLPLYISELFEATIGYFKSDPSIAILANQIWIKIAQQIQQEQQQETLIKFFTDKCDVFLKPLLENLLTTDGDHQEGDPFAAFSRQGSSYCLISLILDITDKAGHQIVMTFIENTINQQEIQYKNAACLAFGSLSQKKDNGSIREILFANAARFADLLKIQNQNVAGPALNVLVTVAQYYPETLINNFRSQEILQLIVSTLQYSLEYLILPISIIKDLSLLMENHKESYIYKKRFFVLSSIAKVVIRPDVISSKNVNIVDRVFEPMLNILYQINEKHILKAYLCQFMVQIYQRLDEERDPYQLEMQSGLTSCVHACLQKLDVTDVNDEEAYEIVQLCQSGKVAKKSDMFYIYAGLAQCQKNKFVKYVQICLTEISAAIQDRSDFESFKASLLCLNDVSKALMTQFKPYIRVIEYFKNLVMNPEFEKEQKFWIIDAVGSIVYATNQQCHVYMNELKSILRQGIADCLKFHEDINQMNHAEKLKDSLICYYYILFQSFDDYGLYPNPELEDTVFPVFRFIRIVCDKKHKNKMPFIRDCVNLVIDLAAAYQSNKKLNSIIKPFITNEFFLSLIRVISKVEDGNCQESVESAQQILELKYNFKLQL